MLHKSSTLFNNSKWPEQSVHIIDRELISLLFALGQREQRLH